MAKTEEKKVSGKSGKQKPGKLKIILFMIMMGLAMPLMLPTVMLVLVGLIPTYVALATDNDPQKSGATSVGAMNIAGLTPFLIDLWAKGQTMSNSFQIVMDPNSWLVILGASGIGQLIVYTIPHAIATVTLTHAEARIKNMRKNLEMLKESWGADVATTKPIDTIGS